MSEKLNELRQLLDSLTPEEIETALAIFKDTLNHKRSSKRFDFRAGQYVKWNHKGEEWIFGVIKTLNQKTATITDYRGLGWRVGWSYLNQSTKEEFDAAKQEYQKFPGTRFTDQRGREAFSEKG